MKFSFPKQTTTLVSAAIVSAMSVIYPSHAEINSLEDLNRFIEAEKNQKKFRGIQQQNEPLYVLPEGAMLCDGNLVLAPEAVKQGLTCEVDEKLISQWINYLRVPED